MRNPGYTKEFSVAVINHAISTSRRAGETQEALAAFLHVGATNIPKYKKGDSKLSSANIEKLIGKYGAPKAEKGEFHQARIISSVSEYTETFNKYMEQIAANALDDIFKHPDAARFFAELALQKSAGLSFKKTVLHENHEIHTTFRDNKSSDSARKAILNWLLDNMRDDAFRKWLQDCRAYRGRYSYDDVWPLPTLDYKPLKNTEFDDMNQLDAFLLGYYANYVRPAFTFDDADGSEVNHNEYSDVVVRGDTILELKIPESPNEPTHSHGIGYTHDVINLYRSVYNHMMKVAGEDHEMGCSDKELALTTVRLRSVFIRLHMNKDMVYRFSIQEDWGSHHRTTVIENVRHDAVIEDYKRLNAFFGGQADLEKDIKQEIAQRGGFIPGAIML